MTTEQQELCDKLESIELALAQITLAIKAIRKMIEEQ
jgi:hypothetical protein